MLEFIPHTKRRAMTKPRAAKIFLVRNGMCILCGTQIRLSDSWYVEHVHALCLGGSDDDSELWPAHTRCKAVKDAQDAGKKAKRDTAVTKGWKPAGEAPKPKGRPLAGTKASGWKRGFDGRVTKR